MNYKKKLEKYLGLLKILDCGDFTYIDVGASGTLGLPWSLIPTDQLTIIGFEPDKEACSILQNTMPEKHRYYPVGLWNEKQKIPVNLAGAMSSIYPPNIGFIEKYEEVNWRRRVKSIENQATVDVERLDNVVISDDISPDFMKIDTQGSEWEIIKGAENNIRGSLFSVLAETWTAPIHKGQKLSFEVEELISSYGFELMCRHNHCLWKMNSANKKGLIDRPQEVGYDVLFFKSISNFCANAESSDKIIRAAIIADIYGFTGYALDLLDASLPKFTDQSDDIRTVKKYIIELNRKSYFHDKVPVYFKYIIEKILLKFGIDISKYAPLDG